MVIAVLKTK